MMGVMRAFGRSILAKVMFVAIVASFLFVGVEGVGTSQQNWIARVAGETVPPEEVANLVRNQVERLSRQIGRPAATAALGGPAFVDQALAQVIDQRLLLRAARDMGLEAGDDQLRQRIQATATFHDQTTGRFDATIYRQTLAQARLTDSQYEAMIRDELSIQPLVAALTQAPAVPSALQAAMLDAVGQRRAARYVWVRAADQAVTVPDDAALAAHLAAHADRFAAPERRDLRVLTLDLKAYEAAVQVTEEQIRRGFEEDPEQFRGPTRYDLRQAVAADEAKARALVDAVKGGQSLETAAGAAGISVIPRQGTDLSGPPQELGPVVRALQPGEVGGPVQTGFGWMVVVLDKVDEPPAATLEEVREQIEAGLKAEQAFERLDRDRQSAEDALAQGSDLTALAQRLGLPAPVAVAGIEADGSGAADGAPELPAALVQAAFAAEAGKTTQLVAGGGERWLVAQVERVTQRAEQPLEAVRPAVVADLTRLRQEEAATRQAEAIRVALVAGQDWAQAAPGLTVDVLPPVLRQPSPGVLPDGVPPALVARLFEQTALRTIVQVEAGPDRIVAQLEAVIPPDLSRDAEAVADLQRELGVSLGQDLRQQTMQALRERYEVSFNPEIVQQLKAQLF